MRVSQAYLILYAYQLMSKVNIVNEKEETGVEKKKRKMVKTKMKKIEFFIRVSCLSNMLVA